MAKIVPFLLLFSILSGEKFFSTVEKLKDAAVAYERAICSPEPETPYLPSEIQQSAGAVLGITERHPPISPATLNQLAIIGINFTFSAPPSQKLDVKPPIHWEGGVSFLKDFNRKGEVFQKWLEYSTIYPKKIILIDDRKIDEP